MLCPKCKYPDSHVVQSYKDNYEMHLRRRECIKCGHRYTTQENMKEYRREPNQ